MRSEIRNLVNIYGEKWKRHYDIADRLRVLSKKRFKKPAAGKRKTHGGETVRVGRAEQPEQTYIIDVNLFAQSLLDGKVSKFEEPPIYLSIQTSKGRLSTCDGKEFSKDNRIVTSYTQLYTSDSVIEKQAEQSIPEGKVFGAELQIEGRLHSTLLTRTGNLQVASSKVIDLLPKEFESKLSLNGIAWGHSL